jgi:hypothetical protein
VVVGRGVEDFKNEYEKCIRIRTVLRHDSDSSLVMFKFNSSEMDAF